MNIVSVEEVLDYAGRAAAGDAERARYAAMIPMVQAAIRSFCNADLTLGTYTEFLPDVVNDIAIDPFSDADAYWPDGMNADPTVLILRNAPIVSVTEVRVVYAGTTGVAGNFPDSSVLASTGYAIQRSGRLLRINSSWPTAAYSVMVTYVGGYSEEGLAGPAADLKLAVLQAVVDGVASAKRRAMAAGGASGGIIRERYPEYEVEYASGGASALATDAVLTDDTKHRLQPYRRYQL